MANSRKCRPLTVEPRAQPLLAATASVHAAVHAALAPFPADAIVAIALSGGLDSMTLLTAAVHVAGAARCVAVHVHHGLSRHADAWQHHAEAACARLGVRLISHRATVPTDGGDGVEAAARAVRYAWLARSAAAVRAQAVLLGHHLDDQVETVLFQLVRGTGLAGASGMPVSASDVGHATRADLDAMTVVEDFATRRGREAAPDCSVAGARTAISSATSKAASDAADTATNNTTTAATNTAAEASPPRWCRPLLGLPRRVLEDYANAHGVTWVEDDSNTDVRYARNALRHNVLPALERHFPHYRTTVARFAAHAAAAQALCDEVARDDLLAALVPVENEVLAAHGDTPGGGRACSWARLRALSDVRLANVLRFWLRSQGALPPSARRLDEMSRQIKRNVSRMSIGHAALVLHGYRDRVWWEAQPGNRFAARGHAAAPNDTLRFVIDTQTLHAWRHARAAPAMGDRERAGDDAEVAFDAVDGGDTVRWWLPQWGGAFVFGPAVRDQPVPERTRLRSIVELWAPQRGDITLTVLPRQGAERFRAGAGRPRRSLKQCFQSAGVPAWARAVPLLYHDDRLIFVPHLGANGTDAEAPPRPGAVRCAIDIAWESAG